MKGGGEKGRLLVSVYVILSSLLSQLLSPGVPLASSPVSASLTIYIRTIGWVLSITYLPGVPLASSPVPVLRDVPCE